MKNLISVVIPVYEMCGDGVFFLEKSFNTLINQTYKNIEVVISDHSVGTDIEELCVKYSNNLNIKYLKNIHNRGGSSPNLNNGLKNCDGTIIKILMQDEFLYDEQGLEKINNLFVDTNVNWVITGCVNGDKYGNIKSSMSPMYVNDIHIGNNRIGSPSVLTIRNENILLFNEDLIWLMDCEYYKRLYDKYGNPTVLNEKIVFISQHDNQLTSLLSDTVKNNEVELMKKTYE